MIFKSPYPEVNIPEGMTLTQYVFQHAQEFGDKPAIVDGPSGRALTYNQ
jgi:hypothetical protein